MSEHRSELSEMSSVSEARLLVRSVAEPRAVDDSVKAAIVRAARRLGFSHSRTRDLWYAGARRIDAAEMDRLRDIAAKRKDELCIARVLEVRNDLAETDPDLNRETITQLDGALRNMGVQVGAVAFRKKRRREE